jgi:arabinan endo-1,5-alpha-L-arabinosidase
VWGGVWTLPRETKPRLGLVYMGGAGATARFAYFRVHRPSR